MTSLRADGLDISVDGARLVSKVSLELNPGELVVLLGPNGAGKTTVMRALLGMGHAHNGQVLLDGKNVRSYSPEQRARLVSYLPQRRPLAWPNTVRDIVALGRFAHGAALGRLGSDDAAAVERALEDCDLVAFADRAADTLSGGELARVHVARALAAGTSLLLADEPVASLDPLHQSRVAGVLRRFVAAGGGALVVLHELNLAAAIADRFIFMRDGAVVSEGTPREVLTAETIADVYGVHASITCDDNGVNVRLLGAL